MAMRQAVASANLQMAIVIGGSAAAELTCVSANGVSIGVNDEIIFCIEKTVTTELMADRTAHTTIPAVGKIACSDDTTSDKLVVFWVAKDAIVAIASPQLTVGVVPAGQSPNETLILSGIEVGDELIACFTVDTTSGAFVDITATCDITDSGVITYPTGTDNPVMVFYWDKTGAVASDSVCYKYDLITSPVSPSGLTAVSGIKVGDEIVSALVFDNADATFQESFSALDISISADGYIDCNFTTAANDVLIMWNARTA